MKRFACTALLLLAAPFAHAATPTDAQIDALMTAMRAQRNIETMLPQVEGMQKQMVAQVTAKEQLSAAQRAKVDALLSRSNAALRDALTWSKLEPVFRDVYRQTFDGADMDAMIAFYSSTAGQHVLDKMPALMQNSMVAMQKLVVPMLQQMQKDLEAETATAGASAPAAMPAKKK